MSTHQNRHAQSLKAVINAIAEAPSLSVAINTHWKVLLEAIDRGDADELKEAITQVKNLVSERPGSRSEWWLVKSAIEQGRARLGTNGHSESHSVGLSQLTASEGGHRRGRIYGMHAK